MALWRGVGSVIAGSVATVVICVLTIVLLPFLGFAAAEIVGTWLPIWVFTIPLALCVIVGGATTGFLQGNTWRQGAILGSLAAALGVTVFGVVFGLVFLLLMLGMIPASGQVPDLSKAALSMATLGGGVGFVTGAVFGAIGGVGGWIIRQEFAR